MHFAVSDLKLFILKEKVTKVPHTVSLRRQPLNSLFTVTAFLIVTLNVVNGYTWPPQWPFQVVGDKEIVFQV